jgi:hypothetical protein
MDQFQSKFAETGSNEGNNKIYFYYFYSIAF